MRPEARARPAHRWLVPLGIGGLALVYLWPMLRHPAWVAFPPRSAFTDMLISHLPNAQYWHASLMTYGQWPLWNDQLFAGQPFAADPLAGLWYPPNWLLALAPWPITFNGLLALHLAWAGLGLYFYLREAGLGRGAASLGAAAFAGTPKLLAHLGAGHVSLVFAVAWTPWLLLGVGRAARRGGWAAGALAGALLAAVFLADVRWAFYAGALAAVLWLVGAARANRRARAEAVASAVVFAFLLSAVLALPLAEFVSQSSRPALTLDEAGAFSLPPAYLLGLLIPNLGGFHEWMTYLGVVPLLLALGGLGRRTGLWAGVALAAAAFSLGTNFVLFPVVFRFVPGAGLLRVPPRAWFMVALAGAVLAAHGLQRLQDLGLPWLAQRYHLRRVPPARALALAALALTVLDLMRVDGSLIDMRPLPPVAPAAAWLQQQPGRFRVYSPSFSLPPGDGLQHLDGVDPLQLARSVRAVAAASGVPAAGYSVTLPAFAGGDPATANAAARPDATRLAQLDVRYVAAEFPILSAGLDEVQVFGRTHVYLNTAWAGRAWLEAGGPAEETGWSPNRVTIVAMGPGRLVVSETAYPGWRVWVDGAPAAMLTSDDLFRAVDLGPGAHQIVFEYWPAPVFEGGALTLVGLLALAMLLRRARHRA